MKHIHFIDPQVETFIKCRKALKFRFGWKRKLKTLRNRGDVVTVFYNYKFSSEIMVKNLGFSKHSHVTEYEFIYFDGTQHFESSKFSCIACSSLFALEPSIEETYLIYSSHTFTSEELACACNLKEVGQKYKFATVEKTTVKHDGENDKVGHEEVVTAKELFIKYKGYNEETEQKEFVFSIDNKECKCAFEIVD